MNTRMLLHAALVTLSFAASPVMTWAQNQLLPHKLSLYEDAGRISYKGMVSFDQQRADIPLDFHVAAEGLDVNISGGAKVSYVRVRVDSVTRKLPVADWADVLRANVDRKVSVVYQIGQEFDDVDGRVRFVNENTGMLLIRTESGSEFFIPLDQVKQVVIAEGGDYRFNKVVPVEVLEIGIDSDISSSPTEMHVLNGDIKWSPLCRLKILDSNKARLQVQAMVDNQLADFKDVEVELNPGMLLQEGSGKNPDAIPGGKLSIRKGDRLILNVQDLEVDYEGASVCMIPWRGKPLNGQAREFPVQSTLRLKLPAGSVSSCGNFVVADEHNRQMANLKGGAVGTDGFMNLEMGTEGGVIVTLTETEVGRESKPVKIGGKSYDKITYEGKLTCSNNGQKFAQLNLGREVLGEVVDGAKATISTPFNTEAFGDLKGYAQLLNWKLGVDKGQRKELVFRYATLVERP